MYAHKKSADKTLFYLLLRSSTTYLPNKRVKPTPCGVSVIALLFGRLKLSKFQKQEYKLNAFSEYIYNVRNRLCYRSIGIVFSLNPMQI